MAKITETMNSVGCSRGTDSARSLWSYTNTVERRLHAISSSPFLSETTTGSIIGDEQNPILKIRKDAFKVKSGIFATFHLCVAWYRITLKDHLPRSIPPSEVNANLSM
jgi:hypothetical protein